MQESVRFFWLRISDHGHWDWRVWISLLIYDGGSKQILWGIVFLSLQFCNLVAVVFFSIKWFSQIWLHTKYEIRKKKKNKQTLSIFLTTYSGTYHKNLTTWTKKIFEIWQTLSHFFHEKSFLHLSKSYFSG